MMYWEDLSWIVTLGENEIRTLDYYSNSEKAECNILLNWATNLQQAHILSIITITCI